MAVQRFRSILVVSFLITLGILFLGLHRSSAIPSYASWKNFDRFSKNHETHANTEPEVVFAPKGSESNASPPNNGQSNASTTRPNNHQPSNAAGDHAVASTAAPSRPDKAGDPALSANCADGRKPLNPPVLDYSSVLASSNYSRVVLRPNFVDWNTQFGNLEPLNTQEQLILQPEHFRSAAKTRDLHPCPVPINVDVAEDPDIETSELLMVGLSTTVDRIRAMLPSLLYSFAHTKTTLYALVSSDTQHVEKEEAFFRSKGLDIIVKTSGLDYLNRYFGLVEAMANHIEYKRPQTRWVAFADDDTFFLSLPNLAHKLNALDSKRDWYIGALSESTHQQNVCGDNLAYGGAGIFISRPTLEKLKWHYTECQAFGKTAGDWKVAECVHRYLHTNFTQWNSLYQVDSRQLLHGLFESGKPIDTLHHWSSWYSLDVVKMSSVAAAAGKKSVLRRWKIDHLRPGEGKRGADGNDANGEKESFWIFTNGYSLVKYTLDVPQTGSSDKAIDFSKMEATWNSEFHPDEKRLGKLRPMHQDGVTKERWLMKNSVMVDNNVHQIYVKQGGHDTIEIVWLGR